jgi:hypothetical protein
MTGLLSWTARPYVQVEVHSTTLGQPESIAAVRRESAEDPQVRGRLALHDGLEPALRWTREVTTMVTETKIDPKPLSPEASAPDLPPRPSELGYNTPVVVRPPVNPEATGIKRVLMILGIIAGFLFYVVPGFFALRTYGYWRRGQAPTPIGWMLFGGLMVAWIVFWMVLAVVSPGSFGL